MRKYIDKSITYKYNNESTENIEKWNYTGSAVAGVYE